MIIFFPPKIRATMTRMSQSWNKMRGSVGLGGQRNTWGSASVLYWHQHRRPPDSMPTTSTESNSSSWCHLPTHRVTLSGQHEPSAQHQRPARGGVVLAAARYQETLPQPRDPQAHGRYLGNAGKEDWEQEQHNHVDEQSIEDQPSTQYFLSSWITHFLFIREEKRTKKEKKSGINEGKERGREKKSFTGRYVSKGRVCYLLHSKRSHQTHNWCCYHTYTKCTDGTGLCGPTFI